MAANLRAGVKALYRNAPVTVEEMIGHDQVLVRANDELFQVARNEVIVTADAASILTKTTIGKVDAQAWDMANKKADAAREYLTNGPKDAQTRQRYAEALGVCTRTFERYVHNYSEKRSALGMIPQAPGRPVGTHVLDIRVERLIDETLREYYLTKERPTVTSIVQRLETRCRAEGWMAPAYSTVARRVHALQNRSDQVHRLGSKMAKYTFEPMPGHVDVTAPLQRVEMDHTPLDLMVRSDDPLCAYVGRPWLTLAIDVYTRCVLGMHLGFESPSTLSVALCLTHAARPKNPLEEFGVPLVWPMYGKPHQIMVDNGRDFRSDAFQRGCREHEIILSYRPVGSPHYGGTIERLMGTMVGKCHLLPGTTKNSVRAKGDYDSARNATLTLSQCRRWFVEQLLGGYHQTEHRSIRMPPQAKWEQAVTAVD